MMWEKVIQNKRKNRKKFKIYKPKVRGCRHQIYTNSDSIFFHSFLFFLQGTAKWLTVVVTADIEALIGTLLGHNKYR